MTLPSPSSNQAFCDVSALEGGRIHLLEEMFITGAEPGKCIVAPSLCFLLIHSETKKKFVFDLGIRKDWNNYPPATVEWIMGSFPVQVKEDVLTALTKGNLSPTDVDYVALSHCHWDHTGNTTVFTNSEFLVGAEAKDLVGVGYPANPESPFSSDLLPAGRTQFLDPYGPEWKPLGPFPRTFDFYGDGSLYLIDAPGHLAGHMNALVRTSPDGGWIYLAGDSAHHKNLISGVSQVSVGAAGHRPGHACAHQNKELAEEHIGRIQQLGKIPRVRILLAHDSEWYEKNKGGSAFWPGVIPSM